MKLTLRHLTVLMLVLSMSISMFLFCSNAQAAELDTMEETENLIDSGTCGTNLTWKLDDTGTLTISGTGKMLSYSDGEAPWNSNLRNITEVVIEDGVTSIGNYAFSDCSSMTSITICDSVTTIGSNVFSDCSSLTNINLPAGVNSISSNVFNGCSNLTSITLPESLRSIASSAFYDCSSLTSISIPSSVTSIGNSAFYGCSSLTEITIPLGVRSIGNNEFYGCSNLTSITVPESVKSIGSSAFYGCSSLTSINIPAGVPSIGDSAFFNCSSLTSIALPETVTSIGSSAFYGCSNMRNFSMWGIEVKSIGSFAFYGCRSLREFDIPSQMTSIAPSTFENCSNLTSVRVPNNITAIGDSAFRGCGSLSDFNIPRTVTSIGNSAFYGCKNLCYGYIEIPRGVTVIEPSTFYGCSNLYCIKLPDGMTAINDSAFRDCSILEEITIPDSLTSIGSDAFFNCRNLSNVNYSGSVLQWNSLMSGIASGNDCIQKAKVHYPRCDVHTFDEGTVTKEATCLEQGIKTFTCSLCGATKTEEVAAKGHEHTEVRNAKAANCKEEGYTGDTYCKDCDTKLSAGESIEKTSDHVYDEGEITTEATCTETGIKTFTCTVCGETRDEEVAAKGHEQKEVRNAKTANCKVEGYTGDTYCKDCGIKLSSGESIKKTTHKNTEIRNKTASTCTTAGYTGDSYCKDCGAKIKAGSSIAAKGHTWSSWTVTKEATTTDTGLKTRTCTVCKTSEKQEIAKVPVTVTVPDKAPASNPISQDKSGMIGQTQAQIDKKVASTKADEVKGSVYQILQLKAKKSANTSLGIQWKKVSGATSYTVYGAKCGTKFKKLSTTKSTSYTQKGLKKGTYYKYFVVAMKNGQAMSTSKTIHYATTGGKVGNYKAVKFAKASMTLKVKKSAKVKVTATVASKKLKVKSHRKVTFESSNPSITSVNASGKVTAKKKGNCYIFAYTQDGCMSKMKIVVK